MNNFIIDVTTNTLTEYIHDLSNGHLEYLLIPHFFNGKQIDSIAPYCFHNAAVETLVIKEGVRHLQTRAFEGSHCYSVKLPTGIEMDERCFFDSHLKEIILPDDLTTIKSSTFARCQNLASIVGGTSVKAIGSQAFAYCHMLKSIDFKNLESVDDTVFMGCDKLQTIALGGNIQSLGKYIFYDCNDLIDVSLKGSFDKLETDTFFGAKRLKHLTLSTSAASLYIPPHCFDDTSLEQITFLGNFMPIVKEKSCFPKNILIGVDFGSPAIELGYYFPTIINFA